MSNMTTSIGPIELSEPMLQCLLSEYLTELAKTSAEQSAALADRLEADKASYRLAMQALTEAVVFSTLACTAESFDVFAQEVDRISPLEDEDVQRMRKTVFMEGMRTGVESIGMDLAEKMKLSDRVEAFGLRAGHA